MFDYFSTGQGLLPTTAASAALGVRRFHESGIGFALFGAAFSVAAAGFCCGHLKFFPDEVVEIGSRLFSKSNGLPAVRYLIENKS